MEANIIWDTKGIVPWNVMGTVLHPSWKASHTFPCFGYDIVLFNTEEFDTATFFTHVEQYSTNFLDKLVQFASLNK